MKKYAFALGQDAELSRTEVLTYLNARKLHPKTIAFNAGPDVNYPFLIINCNDFNTKKAMQELGGVVKLGPVIAETTYENIINAFNQNNFDETYANKLRKTLDEQNLKKYFHENIWEDVKIIGVSIYPETTRKLNELDWFELADFTGDYVRDHVKELVTRKPSCFKASTHKSRSSVIIPAESQRKKFGSKNIEIGIHLTKTKAFITHLNAIHDYKEEKRTGDKLGRPSGWPYGMRTRFARILVNLATVQPHQKILDPFCGIGTILLEAAKQGINPVGRDTNPKAIKSAKKNLTPNNVIPLPAITPDIETGDATNLNIENNTIDGISTEAYLGPSLTDKPTKKEAENIIEKLDLLYNQTLKEMHRVLKPNGRAVFVAPAIQTNTRNRSIIRTNIIQNARKQGFKVITELTHGHADHQVVLRHITILQKPGGKKQSFNH